MNRCRRLHGCWRTAPGWAGRRLAGLRRSAGGVAGAAWSGDVVAVQVVLLHQPDQRRAVGRVGGVDARQRVGERVRIVPRSHRMGVVAAGREQLSVVIDALGEAVVNAEASHLAYRMPVLVLGGGQVGGASGPGALDAEQIVVVAGQAALAPARLINGLRDGHRGGHAVPALGGHRARRNRRNERLLRGRGVSGRSRNRDRRWPVPLVLKARQVGQCAGVVATRPSMADRAVGQHRNPWDIDRVIPLGDPRASAGDGPVRRVRGGLPSSAVTIGGCRRARLHGSAGFDGARHVGQATGSLPLAGLAEAGEAHAPRRVLPVRYGRLGTRWLGPTSTRRASVVRQRATVRRLARSARRVAGRHGAKAGQLGCTR